MVPAKFSISLSGVITLPGFWSSESLLGNHRYAFPTAVVESGASGEMWGPEVGVEHLIDEHSNPTPWSSWVPM